jgi:hypothetical protein
MPPHALASSAATAAWPDVNTLSAISASLASVPEPSKPPFHSCTVPKCGTSIETMRKPTTRDLQSTSVTTSAPFHGASSGPRSASLSDALAT